MGWEFLAGRKWLSLSWSDPTLIFPLDSIGLHWIPQPIRSIEWIPRDSWVESFGRKKVTLSLLIWPDPALTRQTSTQRPDSKILTFKVLHKLNSTVHIGDTFELVILKQKGRCWQFSKSLRPVSFYVKFQTQRQWTHSSTSRFLAAVLLSATWWWVKTNFFWKFSFLVCCIANILCQVSVTQQYETNVVSNKKKRTLHHIGFAVYEVPPNIL